MSAAAKAFEQPTSLKVASSAFLVFWLLIAAFPLVWIVFMSVKLPLDSFASDPLQVIFGYRTRGAVGGLSLIDMVVWIAALVAAYQGVAQLTGRLAERLGATTGRPAVAPLWVAVAGLALIVIAYAIAPLPGWVALVGAALVLSLVLPMGVLAWIAAALLTIGVAVALLVLVLPPVLAAVTGVLVQVPVIGLLAEPIIGNTWQHYRAVWVDNEFYRNFVNSLVVTAGVVTISLTVGTLAGYALARTKSSLAFWLLIAALVFRALPHSVLVTGYLPVFISSSDWLAPLWNNAVTGWFFGLFSDEAPTLYGKPFAVIAVLVAINQPFTIWMLRSFFQNIPEELDEAALVDGCSRFEAFRRVIVPVMWPGVITTGLFSFLLAYNDYLVTALLLDAQNQTMVPAITQYFNRETTTTDQVEAIAAAVSITAPLFLLVMVFQRQIVSGLTAGAVKG